MSKPCHVLMTFLSTKNQLLSDFDSQKLICLFLWCVFLAVMILVISKSVFCQLFLPKTTLFHIKRWGLGSFLLYVQQVFCSESRKSILISEKKRFSGFSCSRKVAPTFRHQFKGALTFSTGLPIVNHVFQEKKGKVTVLSPILSPNNIVLHCC